MNPIKQVPECSRREAENDARTSHEEHFKLLTWALVVARFRGSDSKHKASLSDMEMFLQIPIQTSETVSYFLNGGYMIERRVMRVEVQGRSALP